MCALALGHLPPPSHMHFTPCTYVLPSDLQNHISGWFLSPLILGKVSALKHTFSTHVHHTFLDPWCMTVFPLISNLPPFQPHAPLCTPHNHSPKRLLFLFPYCCCLPPCTSSAACACFRLSCQKSSWIKVTTLQKGLDFLVHKHHTQMALTLQFISTPSSQLASVAITVPQIENQLWPFQSAILCLHQLQITSQTQFKTEIMFITHALAHTNSSPKSIEHHPTLSTRIHLSPILYPP